MKIKKSFVILLDVALLLLGLAAGWVTGWMLALIPNCPVTQFGWLCPACGGTRCVRYFFTGKFAQAFAMNPFVFVLIWYLGAALLLLNVGVLLNVPYAQRLAVRMTGWRIVIVAAVVFAVFGIVRNLI